MEKIYQRAEDKYVATRVVYLNSTDSKLYYDSEFTTEVEADEMKNLFLKGVVCDNGTAILAAIGYSDADGITFATVE